MGVSRHGVNRRVAHSDVIARMVGLDLVAAGWRPSVAGYFQSVTKPRILADVTEAKGERFASMIDHLKKGDMAQEAERLLEDAGWLPEPMRTPPLLEEPVAVEPDADGETCEEEGELPAFLGGDQAPPADNDDAGHHAAA
jgi:ParB family chromosome partitioning protein